MAAGDVTTAETVDLAAVELRELNARLHAARRRRAARGAGACSTRAARTPSPSGLDADVEVEIDGHVGYYCAGMNQRATVRVHGNAGVGLAENMMSGLRRGGRQREPVGGRHRARRAARRSRGDASSRCGISMKGVDIVVRGSVGHMSAFMAQPGCLVVCGDAGDALGDSIYEARLYVRGAVAGLGADCIEKELRDEHRRAAARRCSSAPGSTTSTPPSSAATARRAGSTTSTSTTRGRTDGDDTRPPAGPARLAPRPARVVPLRPQRDPRDPARRARGHLRHPRLRREAPPPALRRPAVPRRERLALPARGLPRALRHRRRAGRALRARAARAEDPDHDRRHELRRALGAGQGGARPRRERGRHVHDDRRRRHDARGARALRDARLPAAALALRHEPRRPAPGRRDRGRRSARAPSPAAAACCSARRSPTASPRCATCRRGSTSAAPAATPTGPGPTTSRSRSRSCARSPTGRSRSSSRSGRRARTTTSRWRSRRAPT